MPVLQDSRGSATLFNDLGASIEKGTLRSGQKLASIRTLANQYNISFATARSAINRMEKMGFVKTRQGSGTYVTYQEGSVLHRRMVRPACLLINSREHVYDHLTAELVELLQDEQIPAVKNSWDINKGLDQLDKITSSWKDHPPRSIVLQWTCPGLDEQIFKKTDGKIRVITAMRGVPTVPFGWHSVETDYSEIGRIAGEYLLERGRKRIGIVTYARESNIIDHGLPRKSEVKHTKLILGLGHVLRQAGLHNTLSIHYNQPVQQFASGRKISNPMDERNMMRMTQWLKSKRPDAVVGMDYRVAAVKKAAESLGMRIPEDLAIVGLGNTPWAEAHDFTSIWLREDLIARHVAEIITADENELTDTARHVLVKPKLVLRTSCGEERR